MFRNTSSRQGPPGPRRGLVLFGRLLRRSAFAAFALTICVLLGAGTALAYWPAAGTGNTTVTVGTLAAPTNVSVPAMSGADVSVSWTASAGPVAPTGYYVTRISGGTSFPACGSGPATLIAAPSCTDTSVPAGTHKYVVTAVLFSWTAASAASGNVSIVSVGKLAFTTQPPASVTAGTTMTVQVQLQTSTLGVPIMTAGVPVTIGLGASPAGGALSGTLTANTDGTGVATFSSLSITKAGAGYSLTASSGGYSGGVSTTFTVAAATAARLVITSPASVTGVASATASIGPIVVERRDTYGNPATGAAATVTLASGTPGTGLFATSANGTTGVTSVSIPAGLASTAFYYGNTKSGSTPFTASGIGQPVSVPVEITAAAASQLVFDAIPATIPKNATFNATVRILDPFNNQTANTEPITLSSSGQGCTVTIPTPPSPVATIAGSATFTGLNVNGHKTGCQLTADSTGLDGATSNTFTTN